MLLQLNQKEQDAFETIAKSNAGSTLLSFLERLVFSAVDIRNIEGDKKEVQIESRILLSKILSENLIERLKVLSGRTLTENNNEFV
jgi:hypothetical protein